MRHQGHRLRAARTLPEAAGRAFRQDVPRRKVVQGGLGLVTGAILGGLSDSYDPFLKPEPAPEPEPEPEPEAAPEPEPQVAPEEVEPEPEPEAEPEPEPEPEPQLPPELQRGSSGDAVRELQEQLNASGYWCGAPDGGFGHLTQQAVWAVQKANGLYRDGIVGPVTRQALASGYRPAPVAGGTHVEVHLASQLLLVVRGGATAMVLNTSTGNGQPYTYEGREYISQTPTGDFRVGFMDGSGWRDGELGEMWRPMFYDGNYAIHGSASIPPYPASHGCARVSVAAMDMIWADGLLGMGGRVVVA